MFSFVLRELSVDMRGLGIDEGGVAAAVFRVENMKAQVALHEPDEAIAALVRDLSSDDDCVQLDAAVQLSDMADESGA